MPNVMRMPTLFTAAVFCCLFFPEECSAAVYKYLDKDGTPCFADNLQNIPEQYRSGAVIVSGEMKDGEHDPDDPNAMRGQIEQTFIQSDRTGRTEGAEKKTAFSTRLLISTVVVFISAGAYVFISRFSHIRGKKKIVSYVRYGVIGAASLIVIVLHARDVATVFGLMGNEVREVKKASEEKGKRAAEFIKAVDHIMDQAQKQASQEEAQK